MTSRGARVWFVLLGIWTCATLVVAHKWLNGMVYDDQYVINGPLIHDPARLLEVFGAHAMLAQGDDTVTAMDTYRPISIASFFWDAWLSDKATWSYHLTNHLAHLASVGFLFALALRMLPQASLVTIGFACLFFGLSPQLAEGHIWINGRSDPLTTAFGLASLLVWRGAFDHSGYSGYARHALCALLFLFGLLCKEVLLLTVPALFLWPEPEKQHWMSRAKRLTPFVLASLAYLGLRVNALQGMRTARDIDQMRLAFRNLPVLWFDGLYELFIPTKLYLRSMRDEYATIGLTQYIAICGAMMLLFAAAWRWRKHSPVIAWSVVWFVSTLGPAALVTALLWPGFGRYLYLPCAGLSLGLCELLHRARQVLLRSAARSRLGQARTLLLCKFVGGAYLLNFAIQLAFVTADYRSNATLYPAIIRGAPQSPHGYGWVGLAIAEAGSFKQAQVLLTQALKVGGFEPRYARGLMRVELVLGHEGVVERDARAALQRTDLVQGDIEGFQSLLLESIAEKSPKQAAQVLCACLAPNPRSAPCITSLERVLALQSSGSRELRATLMASGTLCASETLQSIVFARLKHPL